MILQSFEPSDLDKILLHLHTFFFYYDMIIILIQCSHILTIEGNKRRDISAPALPQEYTNLFNFVPQISRVVPTFSGLEFMLQLHNCLISCTHSSKTLPQPYL